MTPMETIAQTILSKCMGVRKNETVLFVSDKPKVNLARQLFESSQKLCREPLLLEMKPRKINGEEPPEAVAQAMRKADVMLLLTTKSLSHTQARKRAVRAGTRGASMPGITKAMLKRAIVVDYRQMKALSKKIAGRLTKAQTVRVATARGTDLTFSATGRKGLADSGIYCQKGEWGNLPAGEAAIAPVEGTAHGTLVVDASMSGLGRLTSPLKITVRKGYAVRFQGKQARQLGRLIKGLGRSATNIAELGIGTNPKATIRGKVLEDEKVMTTAHMAIGDNNSLGGKTKAGCHLDGVFRKPTIYLDQKKIMDRGRLLV